MQTVMQATANATRVPMARPRAGWIVGGLAALFLLLDGTSNALRLSPAVEGSARLGYGAGATLGIGLLLLACLAVYLLPRTAALGAVLLTGYLGGAVASQVRVGASAVTVAFPIIIGALLWGGLALRDPRLRALLLPRGQGGAAAADSAR